MPDLPPMSLSSRRSPIWLVLLTLSLAFAVGAIESRAQTADVSILQQPAIGLSLCEEFSPSGACPPRETASIDEALDQPEDPWLARDKFLHVSVSFLVTLSGQYAFENKLNMTREGALPLSTFSASMIGIGKEIYDWQWGLRRYFSARDLAANTVGIVLAVIFIVL